MSHAIKQTRYAPSQTTCIPIEKTTSDHRGEELIKILLKYADQININKLSHSLYKKGVKLIHSVETTGSEQLSEQSLLIINKIEGALRDPYGTSMLRKPCHYGELVLDKRALQYYSDCRVALSQEAIELKRHEFAKEIVRWRKSLSAPAAPPKPIHSTNKTAPARPHKDRFMTLDKLKAREEAEALTIREAEEGIKDFEYLYNCVMKERAELQEKRLQQKENAILRQAVEQRDSNREQDLAAFGDHWTRQIKELGRAYIVVNDEGRLALKVVKKMQNETDAILKKTRRELVQASGEIRTLKGEVGSLRSEVSCLHGEVAGLRHEVYNRDDGSACLIS